MRVLTTNAIVRRIETLRQGRQSEGRMMTTGHFSCSWPSLSSTGQVPRVHPIDRFCGPLRAGNSGSWGNYVLYCRQMAINVTNAGFSGKIRYHAVSK